ncbi:MAG: hypothetical protein CM1200mP15_04780 [Dehalococcoidia bacterium]|nr:MAG: hypothetical protein CM1200mP15_04780 [Dehalococcoidia bacterium]
MLLTCHFDGDGIVSAESVYNSINEDTTLVTLMYANNEIGAINPITEIAKPEKI